MIVLWTALIAAIAAVLVVGAWLLRRTLRRRRRRPPREPRSIDPVVLVHGLFGFDEVRIGPVRCAYFHGVAKGLRSQGIEVFAPRLPASASIVKRARCLADFVDGLGLSSRVNIIAHSMGGLDARYAIARLGLASSVNALVTIGSPHQGTPLADAGTELLLGKLGIGRLLRLFGVEIDAFYDLTVKRMLRFNDQVLDVEDIAYASVVGTVSRGALFVNELLVPCFLWLKRRAGSNDGLVAGGSQRWGDVIAEVEADHLAQVGWSASFDALELYDQIVRELRGRGF